MKIYIITGKVITVLLLLVLLNSKISAQNFTYELQHTNDTTEFKVVSFDIKSTKDKIYLKWEVIENIPHTAYLLFRSCDDENYEAIHLWKGTISPNNVSLLYCYTDTQFSGFNVSYKVFRVDNNIITLTSEKRAGGIGEYTFR